MLSAADLQYVPPGAAVREYGWLDGDARGGGDEGGRHQLARDRQHAGVARDQLAQLGHVARAKSRRPSAACFSSGLGVR